jgi:hypothetical protein
MERSSLRNRCSMDELKRIEERLNSAGLRTLVDVKQKVIVVGIERKDVSPRSGQFIVQRWEREVFVDKWDIDFPIFLEDLCVIWNETGSWSFRNSIGKVIGFDPLNSVRVDSLDYEGAAKMASDYLLKAPLRFEHWVVPVYQHPTWTVKRVSECIETAREVHIGDAEDAYAYAMEDVSFSGVKYEWKNKEHAFIRFFGKEERWRVLYLRYDLSDAMIAIDQVERRMADQELASAP